MESTQVCSLLKNSRLKNNMSLVEYIKRDRELDFKHWRYRLLHWTFGADPKSPKDSPMPGFLYTHYCPLFHMTNILAIVSPFVLLIKILVSAVIGAVNGFNYTVDNLILPYFVLPFCGLIKYLQKKNEKKKEARMTTPEYKAFQAKKAEEEEVKLVHEWCNRYNGDMDLLSYRVRVECKYVDVERATKIAEKLKAKHEASRARAEAKKLQDEKRKAELAERFVFWIRFSQVFVKGLTVCLIGAASVVALYGLFLLVPLLFGGAIWTITGFWYFLVALLGFITSISLGAVISVTLKSMALMLSTSAVVWIGSFVIPPIVNGVKRIFHTPLSIAGQVCEAGLDSLCKGIAGAFEFLSALYEDNCPSITVVSEEVEE